MSLKPKIIKITSMLNVKVIEIQNKYQSKLFTFLLITFPIVSVYATSVPGINFAELLMIIYLVIKLPKLSSLRFYLKSMEMNLVYLYFILLFLTLLSAQIFGYYSIYDSIARLLRWGFYIGIIILSRHLINKQYALSLIKFLVIVSCIFLWIQVFAYNQFNKIYTFKLPGIELSKNFNEIYLQSYNNTGIFRPYSLFAEPAHFSYYAIIGLCVYLFINNRKNLTKEFMISIFISISLIASTSSSALALTVIVWLYYLYKLIIKNRIQTKTLYILLLILTVLAVYTLQYSALNNSIQYTLSKFSNDAIRGSRVTSSAEYISLLNDLEKLFGTGIGNEEYYYLNKYGVNFGFTSGIGYLVANSGFIGLTLFILFMLRMLKMTYPDLRVFSIIFIVPNFYEAMLFSSNAIFFLIWACYFREESNILGSYSYNINEVGVGKFDVS